MFELFFQIYCLNRQNIIFIVLDLWNVVFCVNSLALCLFQSHIFCFILFKNVSKSWRKVFRHRATGGVQSSAHVWLLCVLSVMKPPKITGVWIFVHAQPSKVSKCQDLFLSTRKRRLRTHSDEGVGDTRASLCGAACSLCVFPCIQASSHSPETKWLGKLKMLTYLEVC